MGTRGLDYRGGEGNKGPQTTEEVVGKRGIRIQRRGGGHGGSDYNEERGTRGRGSDHRQGDKGASTIEEEGDKGTKTTEEGWG